ncbi:hypothetical protein B0J14DRAFT_240081 [Halenospora varia]|nr:hypothetical protein B0J14DRAFT_240081 [Halenospora varia]
MSEDIRLRAACDRCHSQKLRCPRQAGETSCTRCAKARATCVFSPFRQKKSPEDDVTRMLSDESGAKATANTSKRKRASGIDSSHDSLFGRPSDEIEPMSNDAMDRYWGTDCSFPQDIDPQNNFADLDMSADNPLLTLGFDNLASPSWQLPKDTGAPQLHEDTTQIRSQYLSGNCQSVYGLHVPAHSLGGWNTANLPESTSDLIRRLSELGTKLYENAERMPPQMIHDPSFDGKNSERYNDYSLDDLLNLTQDLIDLYPVFLNTFFGPQNSQPSSESTPSSESEEFLRPFINSSNITQGQGVCRPSAQNNPMAKPAPDHSSILLIFSCHLRLINIWSNMFQHMNMCFRQKGVALTEAQKKLSLPAPKLKVGSYVPPPSIAISMQIHCFVRFADQLLKFARELAAEIHPEDEVPSANLSWTVAQDVMSKAAGMSTEVHKAEEMIKGSGLLD